MKKQKGNRRKTGLFVTGTSTDSGKTVVSALLCRILADSGRNPSYFKPVQTGCACRNGVLTAPDLRFVTRALAGSSGFRASAGLLFRTPAAPVYAAWKEDRAFSFDEIADRASAFVNESEKIICEGAGGLAVPLGTGAETMADLAHRLGLGLVVAGPAGLGALNHFILTEHFAASRGLRTKAFFLICEKASPSEIETDNAEVLGKRFPRTEVVLVPWVSGMKDPRSVIGSLAGRMKKHLSSQTIERWMRG